MAAVASPDLSDLGFTPGPPPAPVAVQSQPSAKPTGDLSDLGFKPTSPASTTPPAAASAPVVPEFKAGPAEPGIGSKILSEVRSALSPVMGETDQQKLDREFAAAQLEKISPTLGTLARQAKTDAGTKTDAEGIAKAPLEHAADIALQGGGAIGGQAIGAATGPFAPVAVPVLGGVGGAFGDYLAQKRRMAAGEQPEGLKYGEIAGAGVAGAIPGGSLAEAGGAQIAKEAVKQGVGGAIAKTAQTEIDEGRAPTASELAISTALPALGGAFAEHLQQGSPEIMAARSAALAQGADKRGILSAARNEGMVVRPSAVNPSALNKGLESFAGAPSIDQAASHINNPIADNIARRILDPNKPDLELTSAVTQQVRNAAYQQGYQPIALAGKIQADQQFATDLRDILANRVGAAHSFPAAVNNEVQDLVNGVAVKSFDAGDGLKMSQILRNDASKSFASGNNELGIAQREASKAIEDQIERHLAYVASGGPSTALTVNGAVQPNALAQKQAADLLSNFRDARKLMAQSHDIEDAIREGGDSIIPSKLGAKFQANPAKLSGGLKTIGGFANNFPQAMRESARTTVPGTTVTGKLIPAMAGILSGTSLAAAGHGEAAGLAAGVGLAVPTVRAAVRKLVLSGPYQRIMAKIPVDVKASPDLTALAIRQGSQAAGQQAAESAAP